MIVPPVPVTKLTHKQQDTSGQGSLFHRLLARANRYPAIYRAAPDQHTRKRILLTWYGSEAGHGTLGDQRSAEAAATALVAAGHDVVVSSSVALDVPGVSLQDWRSVSPDAIDGLVFVCGPILAQHEVLTPIIAKFRNIPKCGCGVSILTPDNQRHWQPFDCLIAREGGPVRFGDIAALAPQRRPRTEPRNRLHIGLCLRGAQIEYGAQNALAQETETLGRAVIQKIAGDRDHEIVEIETHLVRSGLGADGIERQLADCDILITSRFHEAIFAILHEIPCIVLDQIRGGGKLTALLGDVQGLPILRTDQATISQVSDVIGLLNRQTAADRRRLRMGAETAARRSLGFLRGWVNGL